LDNKIAKPNFYLLSSFSLGLLLTLKYTKEMTSTIKAVVGTIIIIMMTVLLNVLFSLPAKTINLFSLEDSGG
jgi:riboflavin transporter FmnP